MTTPKTVDALQEKWTARLGTRVAVHKEERVHQGNSFRYGLYVHSVNTAADMVWPDVWHPAWERGGGAALASLDAALEAKYPEPEPEPFEPTFTGGGGFALRRVGIVHDAKNTITYHTIDDILAALDTHEAVKAWEADMKTQGGIAWSVSHSGQSLRVYQAHQMQLPSAPSVSAPTIVEAIKAALGGKS